MFDQTPVQERHAAIGVFAAIALAGLAAFELLIRGGFSPILPEEAQAATREAPAYVEVLDADWTRPDYTVTPTNFVPAAYQTSDTSDPLYTEDLEGDASAPAIARSEDRSYEDITRDIDALYEETAAYRSDDLAAKPASLSDDGNASPW